MYNFLIIFFLEAILETMISIELNAEVWNTYKTSWQFESGKILTIFFTVVQSLFFIFVVLFMFWPTKRIERLHKYRENLEELYGHLKFEERLACLEPVLYMFNRLVFVYSIYTDKHPSTSI
jgi:hypothetical protein